MVIRVHDADLGLNYGNAGESLSEVVLGPSSTSSGEEYVQTDPSSEREVMDILANDDAEELKVPENFDPENPDHQGSNEQGVHSSQPDPHPAPEHRNSSIALENVGVRTSVEGQDASGMSVWSWIKESRAIKCWEWVKGTTVGLTIFALLAMAAVFDVITDGLTAANFFWSGHVYWGTISLAVLFMSSRYTVLFLALHPTPTTGNLIRLYVPGLWFMVKSRETVAGAATAGDGATVSSSTNPAINVRGGAQAATGANQASPGQNPSGDSGNFVHVGRSSFTDRLAKMLKEESLARSKESGLLGTYAAMLRAEAKLFPFATMAIVPIWKTSCSVALNYLRRAGWRSAHFCPFRTGADIVCTRDGCYCQYSCRRRHASITGSSANSEEDFETSSHAGDDTEPPQAEHAILAREAELYMLTILIVEAMVESIPQLALQIRAGIYGEELEDWVFYLSVSVSVFCVLKAIATFLLNFEGIVRILILSRHFVIEFRTVVTGGPSPGEGWSIASAAEVKANPRLWPQSKSGLGRLYIADLTDNMEVFRPEDEQCDTRVRGGYGGGHVFYSYKL